MTILHRLIASLRPARSGIGDVAETRRKRWRRRWRKSHFRQETWPKIRHELHVILRSAGAITAAFWVKRLIEQAFGASILNERIVTGEVNNIINDTEERIRQRA